MGKHAFFEKKSEPHLNTLKEISMGKIELLRKRIETDFSLDKPLHKYICIYACGSLGRYEMSEGSDLDLFFIITNSENGKCYEFTNLEKYCFFSQMNKINEDLGFPPPSKGGMYWDFISEEDLIDIGSRKEDYNNSLTARALLLLESKPLLNKEIYDRLLDKIIDVYFADYKDHQQDFYPMFLMNDILRYWYTLTLNYEYRRDNNDKVNKRYWKRLKLKFSRLLTCFSLLACLYKKSIGPQDVKRYVKMTPFERLHEIALKDKEVANIVSEIEDEYEWFLNLKVSDDEDWWNDDKNKAEALSHADKFHDLFIHKLMKYISTKNSVLQLKMDMY